MIIVDTNALSEALKPAPEPAVTRWIGRHGTELVVTAITAAELLFGVARLPDGARKQALAEEIASVLAAFDVLPFGEDEAGAFASIRSAQEAAGMIAGTMDIQIAAIAKTGHHSLATRNVKHFRGTGLTLINPWTDE